MLVSSLLVATSLITAIVFPDIDAIFGILGGTTAVSTARAHAKRPPATRRDSPQVVISFVAPALFWEHFVGYMYRWSHPSRLFTKGLIGFSVVVASLSIPGVAIDVVGDLYTTVWWVPLGSSGVRSWSGGLDTLATGEVTAACMQPPLRPPVHAREVCASLLRCSCAWARAAPPARSSSRRRRR